MYMCIIVHPSLCAVYSSVYRPVTRSLIDRNRLQIKGFFPGHKILEIPSTGLRSFDPEGNMFTNPNTSEDFKNLERSGLFSR
jgi:molybdopterin-guanine dinucleotide biosynthesis protein A